MPKGALPVVTAGQDPHRHWAPSFEAQFTDLPPSTSMIGVVIPGTHCIARPAAAAVGGFGVKTAWWRRRPVTVAGRPAGAGPAFTAVVVNRKCP